MPAGKPMRTPWSPDELCPLPEYPRPQMSRPVWLNLNGWWQYAIRPALAQETFPASFDGEIRVPYAVESLLSGVGKPLLPEQTLWYQRTFQNPLPTWQSQGVAAPGCRVLLHFGAVDQSCRVWVNGRPIGEHEGGYLPFTFDITDTLTEGENELILAVHDPSDRGLGQRGKQSLNPKEIWYTAVSGIWQTVWLECVPDISIEQLRLTPDLDQETLTVAVRLRGTEETTGLELAVEVFEGTRRVASASGAAGAQLTLAVPHPRAWSPDDPFLYDLKIRLMRRGQVVDEVSSYAAMRKFGLARDSGGHLRFLLNNQPLFLYGPLDQGYFPDGLYTPPSDEAMLFDIAYAKRIGCNLIRKHVKVEPLRWYYHCDQLGMIVWQDMPNGGKIDGAVVALLALLFGFHRRDDRRLSRFGREDERNRAVFRAELKGMIDLLYNAACIACWVPFNESWGQFHANEIAGWIKAYDPSRLVDHASGWFDQGGGDFISRHVYFKKIKSPHPDRRRRRAFVLSEFGGYSLKIPGHVWDEEKKFGYRFYDSTEELTQAYLDLLEEQVKPLIPQGLTAAVYTQTTDVEIEINGYLTYDRRVEKMNAEKLRLAHEEILKMCKPIDRQSADRTDVK